MTDKKVYCSGCKYAHKHTQEPDIGRPVYYTCNFYGGDCDHITSCTEFKPKKPWWKFWSK